jgi:hypothetical protein
MLTRLTPPIADPFCCKIYPDILEVKLDFEFSGL